MPGSNNDLLSPAEQAGLLEKLQARFEKNNHRLPTLSWAQVRQRLEAHPAKCRSLFRMEETGGQPEVTAFDPESGKITFMDCAPESPKGRRSICYDEEARLSRKEFPPAQSAEGLAADMGVALMNDAQYRQLQAILPLDQKTSSWLLTPPEIRRLGGAIFGDFRYGQVFIYHNGANSYYAARGFRAVLEV